MEEILEMEGIIVKVKRLNDKKRFSTPLAELEVVDKDSNNYTLIDDYAVWCVNY